jgi:hypothetical protein
MLYNPSHLSLPFPLESQLHIVLGSAGLIFIRVGFCGGEIRRSGDERHADVTFIVQLNEERKLHGFGI